MSLYTFENPYSLIRVSGKVVVVDTSYLIELSDDKKRYYQIISDFHEKAKLNSTKFLINVTARQEYIKMARKIQMIEAIKALASSDVQLDTRYRAIAKVKPPKPLEFKTLSNYNEIYKDHVQKGDVDVLLQALKSNIWHDVTKLERDTSINYISIAGLSSWPDLGIIMQNSGLESTDGMITNFAFSIGADAIVTLDVDYVQISNAIDVYLPRNIADGCAVYVQGN